MIAGQWHLGRAWITLVAGKRCIMPPADSMRPLMLSIEDKPPEQDIYITSDLRETWEGSVRWSLEMLNGDVLDLGEETVKATPSGVTPVCRLDFSNHVKEDLRREVVFIAELLQDGKILARQTAFFVPTKHLSLAEPEISEQLRIEQGKIYIELTSRSLTRLVECTLDGADVVFSDNYFDLPAGRIVSISALLPVGWTLSQTQAALKVRSVYDLVCAWRSEIVLNQSIQGECYV